MHIFTKVLNFGTQLSMTLKVFIGHLGNNQQYLVEYEIESIYWPKTNTSFVVSCTCRYNLFRSYFLLLFPV